MQFQFESLMTRVPNGMEFDNLFLDMNGIIHNCSHGEDLDVIPTTHKAMFKNIADYLDRLIHVVRPRRMVRSDNFSSDFVHLLHLLAPTLWTKNSVSAL